MNDQTAKVETVAEHCKHKDCRYRARLSFVDDACFYMFYTNKPRGCSISKCDKYKAGKIEKVMTLDGIRHRDDDV